MRTRLGANDAGQRTAVAQGGLVEILLDEIPTTGYRWRLDIDSGAVTVHDEFLPAPPERPGQGGRHQFVVEAVEPGSQRVRAVLVRPWEPHPRQVLVFDLDVRPAASP